MLSGFPNDRRPARTCPPTISRPNDHWSCRCRPRAAAARGSARGGGRRDVAAFSGEGETGVADLLSGWRVACGPVGSQADAGEIPWHATTGRRRGGDVPRQEWESHAVAVGLRAGGAQRKNDLDAPAAHGAARGRHGLRALDDVALEYARPRLHCDEHGFYARGLSERRGVDQSRSGHP